MKLGRIITNKKVIASLITGIVLLTGLYFRLYPLSRNIERKNDQAARIVLFARLRGDLRQNIEREFPDLSGSEKAKILDDRFQELIDSEKKNIARSQARIKESVGPFKFYLLGSDSYYYYYLTKNLISRGRISKKYENGMFFDPKMHAPNGHWRHIELHPFTGYITYKLLLFLNYDTDPMHACAVSMLILYLLTGGIFSLWLLSCRFNRHVVLISGVFFSLAPIFLQRSYGGWYDTDIYNVLFPLLALIAIQKMLTSKDSYFPPLALAAVCSSYALFWEGWLFLALTVHLVLLGLLAKRLLLREESSQLAKKIGASFLGTALMASVFITPVGIFRSFGNILEIIKSFFSFRPEIWPNLFLTVGELKPSQARKVFHLLGGHFFVISAALGLLVLAFMRSKRFKPDPSRAIAAYSLILLPLALSAERFVLFLHLPASICFAVLYNETAEFIRLRYSRKVLAAATIALYATLIFPIIYAHTVARTQLPIFNRVWEESLKHIKDNTPNGAIVNSWWPPGHFIKAVAERPVTFDGATIGAQRGYWIASALMSTDEDQAAGLLRMLNTSGLKAYEVLVEAGMTEASATDLIKEVAPMSRQEALKKALETLPSSAADSFVSYTHADPPESYVLLYKDLADSSLGLHLLSNWDFRKASEFAQEKTGSSVAERLLKRGKNEDIEQLWQLAGKRIYIGSEVYARVQKGKILRFTNGLEIDLETMTAHLDDLEGEVSGIPMSIIFARAEKVEEKLFSGASVNLSVLLLSHPDGSYSSITAPRDILRSMLFRLYYMNGLGLKNFRESFSAEEPMLDAKVKVFEMRRD